jgi:hypothetical protein
VKNAIKVLEALFVDDNEGYVLRQRTKNPLPQGYRPELDVTSELDPGLSSCYLQLIGILRWAIELGRLDIFHEVSILLQHQALPREGHLEALYHIFAYLRSHENMGRIGYDPTKPEIDTSCFESSTADSTEFYGDVEEELPAHMPKPLGKKVVISCLLMLTMPVTW